VSHSSRHHKQSERPRAQAHAGHSTHAVPQNALVHQRTTLADCEGSAQRTDELWNAVASNASLPKFLLNSCFRVSGPAPGLISSHPALFLSLAVLVQSDAAARRSKRGPLHGQVRHAIIFTSCRVCETLCRWCERLIVHHHHQYQLLAQPTASSARVNGFGALRCIKTSSLPAAKLLVTTRCSSS
jgi:hypothetical protein